MSAILEKFNHLEFTGEPQDLDGSPFKLRHNLSKHPALELDNLVRTIQTLAPERVMYSKGLRDLGANFDRAHIDHKNDLSLKDTFARLRDGNSYIMVRSPEECDEFRELFCDLKEDIRALAYPLNGIGPLYEPKLFLFIASPGAYTPFHIDRYSTVLFQIRGCKEVSIFPAYNEDVVPQDVRESFADYGAKRPLWRDEMEAHGEKYKFSSGEALHIPFMAGHYVKNGVSDISISLSIIFRTEKSRSALNAMGFNHRLGNKLKRLGLEMKAAGIDTRRDQLKSRMMPLLNPFYR